MNKFFAASVLVTASNCTSFEAYVGYGGSGTALISIDQDGLMCMKNTVPVDDSVSVEECQTVGFKDTAKVNTNSIITRGMAVHICSLEQEFSRE
jgi:hypothetical protein